MSYILNKLPLQSAIVLYIVATIIVLTSLTRTASSLTLITHCLDIDYHLKVPKVLTQYFIHGALNGLNLVEVSQCSLCILAFRLFSRHISRTQSFQQNRSILFLALVALKLLVSLISRLVACSARIVVDKQSDKQTHRLSTVTLAAHARRGLIIDLPYMINPRRACAARVTVG